MTNEEAKKSFLSQEPVLYAGAKYKRIKELVYSIDRQNKVMVSAVLEDKNGFSYLRANIKDVEEITQ